MTADSADPTSLADIALRRARHDPDTPFVLGIDEAEPHAVRTITYGQMLTRSRALARALTDAGMARGDRIGCYLPNSPSWVVASLAVWFNGGTVAAAGTLLPGVEAATLFALADAKTVVTTRDAPNLAGDFDVVRIDDEGVLVDRSRHPGAPEWETAALTLPEPDDLAVAIFTSGTTGRPKGITHTHFDIIAAARRVASGVRAQRRLPPRSRARAPRARAWSSIRSATWPGTAVSPSACGSAGPP